GLSAATSLTVKDLILSIKSEGDDDSMPRIINLGGGNLATLLANADVPVGPDDTITVLGSTDGVTLDVVAVAKGEEGAQNSVVATALGVMAATMLSAPLSGSDAALHFYPLTASGAIALGLATTSATTPNNPPVLADISNHAVTSGTTVSFTASAIDPDQG